MGSTGPGDVDEAHAPGGGAEPRAKPPTPWKAFIGRFMLGHFLAYPVCFLTAAGALPFGMIFRKSELMSPERTGARSGIVRDAARDLKLTAIEAAQVEIVLEFALWACVTILVLMHLAVLPWSFAAAARAREPEGSERAVKRGLRIFAGTTATTVVAVAIGGTAGWIWIMTR